MSLNRSMLDFPRNEAGLVDKFIGTAFDAVYNIYLNLEEVLNSKGYAAQARASQLAADLSAAAALASEQASKASELAAADYASNIASRIQEAIDARDFAQAQAILALGYAELAGTHATEVSAQREEVERLAQETAQYAAQVGPIRADLANNTDPLLGSNLIGHDGASVSVALDKLKPVADYQSLRLKSSKGDQVKITKNGLEGIFQKATNNLGLIDNNGTVIVANNGDCWIRQYSGAIQISWFEPKNDGVSSDSAALNSALLANHLRGGGTVIADALLWRLGNTLRCGKGTSLFFHSTAKIIRGHSGDVFRNDLDVSPATTGYSGNGALEIWGGQWEGNPEQFYNTFTFLQLGNAESIKVKHASFLDSIRSHVADLSSVRNVLFEDCRFLGFSGAASVAEPTPASAFTEAIQLDPNISTSFPFGARNGTASSNITVRRCTFGPNPNQLDPRFGSWGCAVGQHGSLHNLFMRDIRVEDCDFEGITYSAIRGMRWVDVWIEDNRFINCRRGVHATPIPYTSSSANNLDGTPSGVGQTGRNWNLKGNTYDGYIDNAIVFAEVSAFNASEDVFFHEDITIAGETFRNGPNNAAIALRYCSGAKVGPNRYENVLRGVDSDCSKGTSVFGGEIANVAQQFVYIRESYLVSAKPSPSSKITVSGLTGSGVGYEFVRVDCPAKDVNVLANNVDDVCKSNNSLAAIAYYGGANGGLAVGNTLRGLGDSKPDYGLYVNATCTGITESGNIFEYTTQPVRNLGALKPPVTLGPVCMDLPQIGAYGTGVLQLGHWVAGDWQPKLQLSSAGNITPLVASTYNLGSAALPFAAAFANQLRVGPAAATQVSLQTGSVSPEGAVAGNPGSLYMQLNGTLGKLWVKETGASNTGWVAK